MIILTHLTVERFRLLREINLHFPKLGSILIQGPNEAGKSALLESIYFALYGEPLAEHAAPHGTIGEKRMDELILYGASNAIVRLSLSVGATELMITRTIERGSGQEVALSVCRLGMPEELITRAFEANERIIAELGGIDGETLRNSYLIEQKGLNRLENVQRSERETTVRKLLGLEKLTRLTEHFTLTESDEQQRAWSIERLKLAEIQSRIPQLSEQLGQIETSLDAVMISENLTEVSQLRAEIAEQELSLEQIKTKRAELKSRQGRILQLKKADTILADIINAYDAIAEAQQALPGLERQITDLERREREELPALEKRVSDLADLASSFGTLERMAADLLTAVATIKELEQEVKLQQEEQDDLRELDEQIERACLELEELQGDREGRPYHTSQADSSRVALEARIQRLQKLAARVQTLIQTQEQYAKRVLNQGEASENWAELKRVQKDIWETEQELQLVENEVKQIQQQADTLEQHWRQISLRRQLGEWQRLKGFSQGLMDAEQHVRAAHEHQEQLTMAALAARRASTIQLGILVACIVLFLASVSGAAIEGVLAHKLLILVGAGIIAILLAAGAGLSWQNYTKAHSHSCGAERQMQEAINQVGMMVAARERATLAVAPTLDELDKVEHEIRTLGGTIPRSRDEAQMLLDQIPDHGESLGFVEEPSIQQRMNEKRDSVASARNQFNVTMEAVAALRKERARLEEQRKKEDWDDIDAKIRSDQAAIEQLQQEVTRLFGEEGLPIPTFAAALDPALQSTIQDATRAAERELGGRLDVGADSTSQVKRQQEALDALLMQRRERSAAYERFRAANPAQQIERQRAQQAALRSALQSLQDSLRLRVKPMGVAFGQAAISSAEAAARKQLESLHITLGGRVELQSRRATYAATLRVARASLSGHYQQLAKFSSTLGSWIVPPNPWASALTALRTRCQREMQEANEAGIFQQLETLQMQEAASRAKIELCEQEIEEAHERIATMLAQHSRPLAKSYTFTEIVAVWPQVGTYSAEDRPRLEEQRQALEEELHQAEQQELALSNQLQTGGSILDLTQCKLHMEQQERSYQTKKRGSVMIQATSDRLMLKILPRTEYYIQQLLPRLTSGRYHDVHLTTEPEEGGALGGVLLMRVWDSAAGEYIRKSALSGGTADQLSFALRLAFAIATLPRELNAASGFLLLDEPLSSFDRKRAQALVDVVTGELLSQHFEQILFVSHSSAFDPALFPYHVYIEGGAVVESNLPVVPVPIPPEVAQGTVVLTAREEASPAHLPVSTPIAVEL